MGFHLHVRGLNKKAIKKVFRNPSHSKFFKFVDPTAHYGKKVRKKLGLTGHKLKKLFRSLKPSASVPSTSVNSAGAVVPSHVGRSVSQLMGGV